MREFRQGDRVSWRSHGGLAIGTVQRKITADEYAAKRQVRASADNPQYLVRSDNGGDAVHRPSALTKVDVGRRSGDGATHVTDNSRSPRS